MKEYGSDFSFIENFPKGISFKQLYDKSIYYACGRHALVSLIINNQWKRIWMPSYFCYEVNDAINNLIKIEYYDDYPLSNDNRKISVIPFKKGDVLLRMNYFGTREFRDESLVPVPVIEDHSHDLIGGWAKNSNADWCYASLRKTLPLSEGGVLWSPKSLSLPDNPIQTKENLSLVEKRFEAMRLKSEYLAGENVSKELFRSLYISTEKEFESLPLSQISTDSWSLLNELDIRDWYQKKQDNWKYLSDIENEDVKIITPENQKCNMFSLILMFANNKERERVREILINRLNIYPAILWNVPNFQYPSSIDFSETMLSIHCDARYYNDLEDLRQRIITAIYLAREK